MPHKVRRVLDEDYDYPPNRGKIEVGESLVIGAGPKSGRQDRLLGDRDAWLVAAVERIVVEAKGKAFKASGAARLEVIEATDAETLTSFVAQSTQEGTTEVTDPWRGYGGLGETGYDHESQVQTNGEVTNTMLPKVHILFSTLKAWLIGFLHGVSSRNLWAYC